MNFVNVDNNHTMKNTSQTNLKSNQFSYETKPFCDGSYDDPELAPLIGGMFRAVADMGERPVVVVCFGTTAISGDSLGPQVGSMLRDVYNVPAFVYGTEEHSVNGKNMAQWLAFIKAVHEGAIFIAVDASLGSREKVGQILLRNDGVCPAAIKGKKARFGDVGILAVVAENGDDPLMRLMAVSQVYVANLANKISILLKSALLSA
ncbi:MAG: DUF1256 domain-containing protein [Clostridiales bacterium]|nr:DUF1256 domain-containing protein [Clostridiales bacterium]